MPRVATLERFSGDDLAFFGDAIRSHARSAATMEGSARMTVDLLWAHLEATDGGPALALVRLYKTHPYGKLPEELRAFARRELDEDPDPETRCLTLLATRGIEPDWNDRRKSQGHKAIPLPSVEFIRELPMVAGLIDQLGLELADVVRPDIDRIRELARKNYDVFHVADARDSAFVPAQGFVEAHGIMSALGFGGVLFSGDFYAVVMFSRVPISADTADRLRVLSLATRVSLMPFGTRVFD
jgi:hypothetical protein